MSFLETVNDLADCPLRNISLQLVQVSFRLAISFFITFSGLQFSLTVHMHRLWAHWGKFWSLTVVPCRRIYSLVSTFNWVLAMTTILCVFIYRTTTKNQVIISFYFELASLRSFFFFSCSRTLNIKQIRQIGAIETKGGFLLIIFFSKRAKTNIMSIKTFCFTVYTDNWYSRPKLKRFNFWI